MKSITSKMRDNAEKFATEWGGTTSERSESQTFINEFFKIFGLDRKNFAQFEKPIKKKNEKGTGFADLFWSGKLIIEAKSSIKDSQKHWDEALVQAEEYIDNLKSEKQIPKYILLINFKKFRKYTVEKHSNQIKTIFNKEIELGNLASELDEFLFFPEFASQLEDAEEEINQDAARLIANVYDTIERKGYEEDVAIFLTRLMFCMFAEDTGIFELKQFENFLRNNTTSDNLGNKLKSFFNILNTPLDKRQKYESTLMNFPYVNGKLFEDNIDKLPVLNTAFRETLIKCCEYDWSFISPVIFGSLFQAVIHEKERKTLGAHYTSEKNIMRVIRPLFLDDLRQEFESVKNNKNQLDKFRKKLSELRFLDPASGCGNFLVVTYRELRQLDMEIIRLQSNKNLVLDVSILSNVHLTNFYGYEINKPSVMIAEVAMWLTEHQMNMRLENEFGKTIPTIPLKEAANIKRCNALDINWTTELEGKYFDYILGNPPFAGKKEQKPNQKQDLQNVFNKLKGSNNLDYVTGWYVKASEYMAINPQVEIAFVSTNSISQGEQVVILWKYLKTKFDVKINFAHQTFKWINEAKGVAAVHCVIIGFAKFDRKLKKIYTYEDIKSEPTEIFVKQINSYLIEGNNILIVKRNKPITNVQEMNYGSMPIDAGFLIFKDVEKKDLVSKNPSTEKFFRQYTGGEEFIKNKIRWCLWLKDFSPNEIAKHTDIMNRIKKVQEFREKKSTREETNKLAKTPALFGEIRQPTTDYILVPKVSSENRKYIPIGICPPSIIASGSCLIIPNAQLYTFGLLTSSMHMTWTRYVCGRMKSDYQYSASLVYNNFPAPKDISEKKKESIEIAAQTILDIRKIYRDKGNSLANIYGIIMPPDLLKAHENLDKLFDKCYRDAPFTSEQKRIEFLFDLYEKYTANLFTIDKKKKK